MSLKTDPIRRGELRMTQFNTRKAATRQVALAAASALAISMAVVGGAQAQNATTTLRGAVYDGQTVETGATVVATEVSTGYATRARVGADGRYVLSGLRPGTYRVQVTSADGQTAEETVTLSLGQVGTLNLDVAGATTTAATAPDMNAASGPKICLVQPPTNPTNVTTMMSGPGVVSPSASPSIICVAVSQWNSSTPP